MGQLHSTACHSHICTHDLMDYLIAQTECRAKSVGELSVHAKHVEISISRCIGESTCLLSRFFCKQLVYNKLEIPTYVAHAPCKHSPHNHSPQLGFAITCG